MGMPHHEGVHPPERLPIGSSTEKHDELCNRKTTQVPSRRESAAVKNGDGSRLTVMRCLEVRKNRKVARAARGVP